MVAEQGRDGIDRVANAAVLHVAQGGLSSSDVMPRRERYRTALVGGDDMPAVRAQTGRKAVSLSGFKRESGTPVKNVTPRASIPVKKSVVVMNTASPVIPQIFTLYHTMPERKMQIKTAGQNLSECPAAKSAPIYRRWGRFHPPL